MNTEVNDPKVVDDIVDRWCRNLLSQVDAHVDALKAQVALWEPRPCPSSFGRYDLGRAGWAR